MPITIETSPALVTGTGTTVTTASFTPPSSSLLVATVVAASGDDPVVSGGSLTWTRRVRNAVGGCDLWTAPVVTGASMTVSVAITDTGLGQAGALKVDVVTGHNTANPIGNTGTGNEAVNNATVTGYTSSGESRGFCAAQDSGAGGTPSSTDVASAFHVTSGPFITLDGMAVRKAADTSSAGLAVTFNLDAAGSSADWDWAALEIVALPAVIRPRIVIPTGAVHRASSW